MSRTAWTVLILGAWVGALGWLVKRVAFRSTGERLAAAALAAPPGTEFFRVDLAGHQVGFASMTLDTAGPRLRVTDLVLLDLRAGGRLYHTRARAVAVVTRALRLETLDVAVDGESRFLAHASVSGDTALTVTLQAGTDTETSRLRLAHPILLPSLLPLRLAFGGALKPGRASVLAIFDPFALSEHPVGVTTAKESTLVVSDSAVYDSSARAWVPARFDSVPAFLIIERAQGLTTDTWIDADGRLVRSSNPTGLTVERSAYELAYENFRFAPPQRAADGPEQPVAATALAAGVRLKPGARRTLRLEIGGIDLRGLELAGGRQRRVGDTLTIDADPLPATPGYRLPATDPSLARWLGPEPLIPSSSPSLVAQARAIVGTDPDPGRAARRLAVWVTAHVRPEAGTRAPSALDVLRRRAGGCNETTVLYVALARAVGLPARPVAGLVEIGGRFYYHAWPEVFLGDWVPLDPLLHEFPADAGHVRFAVGALARQIELFPFVGRATLKVL